MSLTTIAVVKAGSYIWAFVKETFLRDVDMDLAVRRNKWVIITFFFFLLSTIGMATMYDTSVNLAEQVVEAKKQLNLVQAELDTLKTKPDQSATIAELRGQIKMLSEVVKTPPKLASNTVPVTTPTHKPVRSSIATKLSTLRD